VAAERAGEQDARTSTAMPAAPCRARDHGLQPLLDFDWVLLGICAVERNATLVGHHVGVGAPSMRPTVSVGVDAGMRDRVAA